MHKATFKIRFFGSFLLRSNKRKLMVNWKLQRWRANTVYIIKVDCEICFEVFHFSHWLHIFYTRLLTPTWASSGSWAGSAVPAVPPFSQTSWSWRSGSAPRPRPPSDACRAARRCASCTSARSRRWRRRCWRRRPSTFPETRSAASPASAEWDNNLQFTDRTETSACFLYLL